MVILAFKRSVEPKRGLEKNNQILIINMKKTTEKYFKRSTEIKYYKYRKNDLFLLMQNTQ